MRRTTSALLGLLVCPALGSAQNFDDVQIRTTRVTESIYMLQGSGGNIAVSIGDDGTFIVDDFARRMVAEPDALDVIVLPNLYGDILSDLGAGVIGGLGLAPSGCYGDDYAYFESAHGSAPDIAGQNIINPTATLLSGAMMLDYLGFGDAAARVERAVDRTYADGKALTRDQGGSASTQDFIDAVAQQI